MITKYNTYNESLKGKLKGKSDEEVKQQLLNIPTLNRIRKIRSLKLDDSFLPSDEEIKTSLERMNAAHHIKTMKSIGLSDKFLPSDDKVLKEINISNDPPELLNRFIELGYSRYVKFVVDKHFLSIERYDLKQEWLNYGMIRAFKYAKVKIFEYFLELGADVNSIPNTKLDVYASLDKKERMRKVYYKYKNMNESLRDKLKGKSDEQILNSIDGLSIFNRISKVIELGLDERFMPSDEQILRVLRIMRPYERIENIKDYNLSDRFYPTEKEMNNDVKTIINDLADIITYDQNITKEEAIKYWNTHWDDIYYHAIELGWNAHDIFDNYIDDSTNYFEDKGYVFESLKDKLKGKSQNDIFNAIKDKPKDEQLKLACQYGLLPVVKKLIEEYDVSPIGERNWPIKFACKYGQVEIAKYLLGYDNVDPSTDRNMAIKVASSRGHVDIVKLLMSDDRVDPSDGENNALRCATENDDGDVVRELLKDKRVDITDDDYYVIRHLTWYKKLNILEEILKSDNFDNNKIKHRVQKIATKYYDEIMELINKYVNVNESLKGKLKGKSKEELKNELGITDDYITVEIWNPGNYELVSPSAPFEVRRNKSDSCTRLSGKFMDILNYMMDYNSDVTHSSALSKFKNSIIKNDN
jgi:ankyrin repeat protein